MLTDRKMLYPWQFSKYSKTGASVASFGDYWEKLSPTPISTLPSSTTYPHSPKIFQDFTRCQLIRYWHVSGPASVIPLLPSGWWSIICGVIGLTDNILSEYMALKKRSRGKRTVNNDEIFLEKLPRGVVGTAEIHRVELYHPGDNQDW